MKLLQLLSFKEFDGKKVFIWLQFNRLISLEIKGIIKFCLVKEAFTRRGS